MARIEYVRDVTDVAQFDDLFVTVLAARIAAEICMALTDNATATKNALDAYRDRSAEARIVDAQEGTPRDIVETSGWLVARARVGGFRCAAAPRLMGSVKLRSADQPLRT